MLPLLACLALGSVAPAHAAEETNGPDFPSVVEQLAGGQLDWTRLILQASSQSAIQTGAWQDRRLQEQDALNLLTPRIEGLAREVRVTPETNAGELMGAEGELGRRLEEGLRRWAVDETRYHSKGSVEMDASLDLRTWLRPALAALATTELPPLDKEGATGIVVDARGVPFRPSIAPTVSTPTGEVVIRASMLSEEAVQSGPPILYITDPADPRAYSRGGSTPLFCRSVAAREGELVLDADSAARLSASAAVPALVARGRVAIIVDP